MRDLISDLLKWPNSSAEIALATVISTWGSAPRKTGAKMALSTGGQMIGSVSGGCIEGEVATIAQTCLADGKPQHLSFGVADETAWSVGLACGGKIELFVETVSADFIDKIAHWLEHEESAIIATVIRGDNTWFGRKWAYTHAELDAPHDTLPAPILVALRQARAQRQPTRQPIPELELELFIEPLLPRPQLVIIGGVHIAQALIPIAECVGFRPIVIDPRRAFANTARFPHITLLREWPRTALPKVALHAQTAIALLTHDPKIDDQALEQVWPHPVFYIGALGSRNTATARLARLREKGVPEGMLQRLHSPIGLDLHAQTPEEIALSIMAQIIAVWRTTGGA